MKRWMAVVAVAMTACSGATTIPNSAIEGGPGQDISVAVAGVENSEMPLDREHTRRYVIGIEVSNNSDHPVTVTRISLGPSGHGAALQIGQTAITANEMIDPGDEHVFEIPVEGRVVRNFRPEESRSVEFRVIVSLANGETYFYTFDGPIRH